MMQRRDRRRGGHLAVGFACAAAGDAGGRVLHRQISQLLALEDAVDVAGRVPQTRGYRYAVANDRVLLVGTSRIVVGVFADANARRAKHAGFTKSA